MPPPPTWGHGEQSRCPARIDSGHGFGAATWGGAIGVDAAFGLMVSLGLLLACALALITVFALTAPGRAAGGANAELQAPAHRQGIGAARLPVAYRRWRHARRRQTSRVVRARARVGE